MSDKDDFSVTGLADSIPISIGKSLDGEVAIYTVTVGVGGGDPIDLSDMKISLIADAREAAGRWYPVSFQYQRGVGETWLSFSQSSYACNVPLYCYYRTDDKNLLTVAIDDTMTSWEMCSGIDEFRKMIGFTARPLGLKAGYRTFRIYVDRSGRPYYESIRGAALWWKKLKGSSRIPECAYDPVYSTWYSFHRELDAEKVLAGCRKAAEVGCRTVIIDDGWATPIETKSFEYTGD